jgi:hypothetical protein
LAGGFDQDAEDHCGRGRDAQGAPKYKRIVRSTKKFYAHDEQSSARMGDVVRIRETRPLSKLKRWSLEEIVRRSSLGQIEDAACFRAKSRREVRLSE